MDTLSSPETAGTEAKAPVARQKKSSKKNLPQVLVVDHNPIMGRIIGRVLGRSKLGFALATNAREAIDFCKDTQYDLILMTARMPGMSGMDATRQIRTLNEHYETVPIVAVAARVSAENIKEYEAAGMKGVLKKPVNEINLLNIVSNTLGISFDRAVLHPPKDDDIYAVLDEDEMSLLNWDTLREYSALMKADYIPLMKNFLTAAPDLIGQVGEAVVDGNAAKILELTHQLKSTSLIFGAEDLSNTAAQLEIIATAGDLSYANQYYKELHMIFERVKPVLHKKLVLMHSMK